MSDGLDRLVDVVRNDDSLKLSPAHRQVLINRISFPPTDGELDRARAQIMGRTPAMT